jgi:large conductance mechanosensitive channel
MATKKEPVKAKKPTKSAAKTAKPVVAKSKLTRLSPIRTTTTEDDKTEIVLTVPPLKAPRFLQGFVDFVRTQGVVGLAVGLVLGVAAKSVVDSLVANFFNPIIGMVGGGQGSVDGRFVCLKYAGEACTNKLGWGNVLSNLISFMIVASVVYFVVKGLKLDKLDKPKS